MPRAYIPVFGLWHNRVAHSHQLAFFIQNLEKRAQAMRCCSSGLSCPCRFCWGRDLGDLHNFLPSKSAWFTLRFEIPETRILRI